MSTDIFDNLPEALSAVAEQELASRACKDVDASNELALSSMREAILYAGRCARGRIPEGDLFSLAWSALCKAAPRFKPGMIRFFSYAKQDIRGEISDYWKGAIDTVKHASLHRDDETTHLKDTPPSPGVNNDEIDEREHWSKPESEPLDLESDITLPEYELIGLHERWELVKPRIHALNEREQTVLKLIYEAGFNFEQVGKMMVPSVKRQAIAMTHDRALRKIRNSLLRCKRLYN